MHGETQKNKATRRSYFLASKLALGAVFKRYSIRERSIKKVKRIKTQDPTSMKKGKLHKKSK